LAVAFFTFTNAAIAGGMPGEEPEVKKEVIVETVIVEEPKGSFAKFIFLLLLFAL
jgi:hypothetical protein